MNASMTPVDGPTHCAGCDRAFLGGDGRYLTQLRPGGALIALCDSCGERYAELVVRDPDGAELGAMAARILLAEAPPQGTAARHRVKLSSSAAGISWVEIEIPHHPPRVPKAASTRVIRPHLFKRGSF